MGVSGLLHENLYPLFVFTLGPPSLFASTEIGFGPLRQLDHVVFGINVTMSKGKRKWSRSTDYVTIRSVLRSMARALELVPFRIPRDHAT